MAILLGLFVLVAWTVMYFIYRFLFFHFIGEKQIANSSKYKAQCAEIDRQAEYQQRIADEKYFREKKEYDEVVIPQYEAALKEWRETQNKKIADADTQLEQLEGELSAHYESTKVVPVQYRTIAALKYIYSMISTSDYDVKEAIDLYDRKVQRELDEAKLREQRRANALADEQSALIDEQNALLDQQNSIADRARHEARQAAAVAAVQRHNTNKLLKERNQKLK